MARDPSLTHLLGRLAVVEDRVRVAVARRRAVDPNPDDAFRGLYLSHDDIDRLLDGPRPITPDADAAAALVAVEAAADELAATGARLRVREVQTTFGLDPFDVELLLVALAPDVDARFERFYGYLHDDVTRRRASVGLALELAGVSAASGAARARLLPGSPLVAGGLLLVEDGDRPFLTRALRVPDRVAAHLLGDDTIDPVLAALVRPEPPLPVDATELGRALSGGVQLAFLHEKPGASAVAAACSALRAAGLGALAIDATRLAPPEPLDGIIESAVREARLRRAGLVVGPIEPFAEGGTQALRRLTDSGAVVVLHGTGAWDPAWSAGPPLLAVVEPVDAGQRTDLARQVVNGHGAPDGTFETIERLRLTPEQVVRAMASARQQALYAGRDVSSDDVRVGVLAQNSAGLERLARRIEPRAGWENLILPPEVRVGLEDLVLRAKFRVRVHDDWSMKRDGWRGDGATALFAGPSGTGKTLAAEVVAAAIGVDLYAIDLATVVDKYIGETEKNLDRIFREAEHVNGVLLFDEADALFGKRSDVKDARDRYANVEIAYLLQRMETFDGLAVLTTNLRANLDEAFTRRLDVVVDFPPPAPNYRLRLWDQLLGSGIPRGDDIDFEFLAANFELSGGNIRNIVVAAAFLAAADDAPVSMQHLILGTQREYRKLGRLCLPNEFGQYHELLTTSGGV